MTLTSLIKSSRSDTDFFLEDDKVIVHIGLLTQKLLRLVLVFWLLVFNLRRLIGKITIFSIMEAFDIEDVLFFFFRSNIDTYCRRVLALFPSLSIMVPKTFLVVLVFFLVGERYVLPIRYINREDVGRLILPRVLILLFR